MGALGSFDFQPDVIVSGINAGANVGRSVLHSGTVGAVLSGAQLGLSGLAVSVQWGENVHYDTAAVVAIEVLEELFRAPSRTLLNLNVPNLALHELKGVRRGRISTAGLIKAAGPRAGGEPLSDEGELPLRLGAASPVIGDVSDEDADEDGALLVAGFASLTPIRGPHEDDDPGLDSVMHNALNAMKRQLDARTSQSSTGRRRCSFKRPRNFFSSTRRTVEPLVGLVARRGVRGASAVASLFANWSSAARRF